jgi:hypothetical protein
VVGADLGVQQDEIVVDRRPVDGGLKGEGFAVSSYSGVSPPWAFVNAFAPPRQIRRLVGIERCLDMMSSCFR